MAHANPTQPTPPLRLVIVDADHRVRESLAALVGSGDEIDVIGAVGHPAAVIDLVEHRAPDVVILDPRLPEVDAGLALVSELRRRWPRLGVLVMSWSDELESACIERGATRFVRKSSGPNELVEAILTAAPLPREADRNGSPASSEDGDASGGRPQGSGSLACVTRRHRRTAAPSSVDSRAGTRTPGRGRGAGD